MLSLECSVRSAEPESAAASGGLLSRNGIGEFFQPNTRNGALETRYQTGKVFWLLKGNLVPTHRTAENGSFEPKDTDTAFCMNVSFPLGHFFDADIQSIATPAAQMISVPSITISPGADPRNSPPQKTAKTR